MNTRTLRTLLQEPRLSRGSLGRLASLALIVALLFTLVGCQKANPTGQERKFSVLRVGMECAYAPYNWTQSKDAHGAVPIEGSSEYANGYDVQVAKHLAESMGFKLQIVRSDWDSLVPAVQSGVVDCVIAGQSITPERQEQVDFTQPYYRATIVALTRKDSSFAQAKTIQDLRGARVTSQLNTIWYDTCLPQIPNAEILAGQTDAPAMLVALQSGVCDLVVTDRPTAQMAVASDPNLIILAFPEGAEGFQVAESDIQIGISVQKGNDVLLQALNAALADWDASKQDRQMQEAISWQLELQQGGAQ